MSIVKIGSVELTPEEAFRYYQENKYIVTYGAVYQLHYSTAKKRVYGSKIYTGKRLTLRGYFYVMDAESVNRIVRFELIRGK